MLSDQTYNKQQVGPEDEEFLNKGVSDGLPEQIGKIFGRRLYF